MSENTEVIVFANYEELILNKKQIEELLKYKIQQFDAIEQISYCSFLNMICQTTYMEELLNIQYREFRGLPTIRKIISGKQIIFHRDTLMFYISQIIANNVNGNSNITGHNDFYKTEYVDFGRCLLMSNSIINELKQEFFEREFIKSIPYHLPNTLYWYYYHRIIRYSYIYSHLLEALSEGRKDKLKRGINIIEERYNLKLNDLFDTVKKCFNWFLGLRENYRIRNLKPSENIHMFDYNNIHSFYIQRNNFIGSDTFIKVIDLFSKDFEGFRDRFIAEQSQRDIIDNDVYKYIRCFYDYPVYKINQNSYCIIDFKFLMERICTGLTWLIKSALETDNTYEDSLIKRIREQNGYLLELYFSELMKKIFGENVEITSEIKNSADATIETIFNGVKTFVLFEFTTKPYRIASLYNKSQKSFIDDIDRLLFKDHKKDMGKFVNMNKYISIIEGQCSDNKIIIPVIVTESPIGDYDLINRYGGYLDKTIQDRGLDYLLKWKPIILTLEDIEFFWGLTEQENITQEFIRMLLEWQNYPQKGKYWYYFGNFANREKFIVNNEYLKIFNKKNLM